jgi:hypothetical protein
MVTHGSISNGTRKTESPRGFPPLSLLLPGMRQGVNNGCSSELPSRLRQQKGWGGVGVARRQSHKSSVTCITLPGRAPLGALRP